MLGRYFLSWTPLQHKATKLAFMLEHKSTQLLQGLLRNHQAFSTFGTFQSAPPDLECGPPWLVTPFSWLLGVPNLAGLYRVRKACESIDVGLEVETGLRSRVPSNR